MYSFISALFTLAAAIPAPGAASSKFPVIDPNAWNFVVNAIYASKVHLSPINVDSSTGFLTTATSSGHMTLGFDDQGHATDPYNASRLNLTNTTSQALVVKGPGDQGFAIKDGILTKNNTTSWGMCPNDEGSHYIYWVEGESPCNNMIDITIAAIPVRVWI